MQIAQQHKGIFIALFSAFIFAVRLCIIKLTPVENAEALVFFRFLFDFIILSPFFIVLRRQLRTKRIGFYVWRSFLVFTSLYCSTYGVKHLALADAALLQYTFPLFIALFLWIFYKKRISPAASCALLMGFGSVFFLLKPHMDIFHIASFASLGAAVASAILAISLYELGKTEHPITILFYCTLFGGLISLVLHSFTFETVSTQVVWQFLIPSSLLGVAYQYLMIRAYSYTSAHIVGSFSYFCVLFSTVFGWLIWGETLETMKIAGGLLVILCGILMVYENNRNKLPQRDI